jgi:hypothetical protein
MKLIPILSFAVFFICLLASCNGKSELKGGSAADSLNAGEKAVYSENGKLHYIIESKDGKTNGRVREYSPDGKLYMDAMYKDDHRNGKCTFYFKNGKPFSICNFINGAKDGIDTKYNEKGQVLAIVPYKNNRVQPGLKEFASDGSEILNDNNLVISGIDHTLLEGKYILQVGLAKPKSKVTYYAASKSDPEARQKLINSGNYGIMEIPVSSSHFVMKSLLLEAEYKTQMGNVMVIRKDFKLAIDK